MTGQRDHREVQLEDSWRVGVVVLPKTLSFSRFEVAALRPRNNYRVSSVKPTSGKRVRPCKQMGCRAGLTSPWRMTGVLMV